MTTQTLNRQLAEEKDVSRLIQIVSRQIDTFDQSLDLGLKQRHALINHKLEQNAEVNAEQEKISVKLEELERERIALTARVYRSLGTMTGETSGQAIKCRDLYPCMTSDNAERLEELKEILRKKVENMRKLNDQNAILIQNSRNIIHATLGIITGLAGQEERRKSKTYGSRGKIQPDGKQKVRLFNRKV